MLVYNVCCMHRVEWGKKVYILTLLALLPWWLFPTRKTSLERGSIIRNFLSLQVVARREPVLKEIYMYFRLILDACIDLPIEWHGVDCIWVTLNCIDRLAFGYIPDENPMIESSTEQNIFGCWMPFEECNSSSAMCKLWIIMMALPTNSWISIDAQLGLWKKRIDVKATQSI